MGQKLLINNWISEKKKLNYDEDYGVNIEKLTKICASASWIKRKTAVHCLGLNKKIFSKVCDNFLREGSEKCCQKFGKRWILVNLKLNDESKWKLRKK